MIQIYYLFDICVVYIYLKGVSILIVRFFLKFCQNISIITRQTINLTKRN